MWLPRIIKRRYNDSMQAFEIPGYEIPIFQDKLDHAVGTIFQLLDERYVESVLHDTIKVLVESWAEEEWEGRYDHLLAGFGPQELQNIAIYHAAIAGGGEMPPDPEDIPEPSRSNLAEDFNELPGEAQRGVLLAGHTLKLLGSVAEGAHPFKAALAIFEQLAPEAQREFAGLVLKQYVRQYHNTRQSRN